MTISINRREEGVAVRNLGEMTVHVSEFAGGGFEILVPGTGIVYMEVFSIEDGTSRSRHTQRFDLGPSE